VTITTSQEGEKTIAIYNLIGQQVYSTTSAAKDVSANISNLQPGIYYAVITDAAGIVRNNRLKFVKQ
jgi:hypothetical protein